MHHQEDERDEAGREHHVLAPELPCPHGVPDLQAALRAEIALPRSEIKRPPRGERTYRKEGLVKEERRKEMKRKGKSIMKLVLIRLSN